MNMNPGWSLWEKIEHAAGYTVGFCIGFVKGIYKGIVEVVRKS